MQKSTTSSRPTTIQPLQKIIIAVGAFCLGLVVPLLGLYLEKSSIVPITATSNNEIVLAYHHRVDIVFPVKEDGKTSYYSDEQKQRLLAILKNEMNNEANDKNFIISSVAFSAPKERSSGDTKLIEVPSKLLKTDNGLTEDYQWEIEMLPDGSFKFSPGAGPGYQG